MSKLVHIPHKYEYIYVTKSNLHLKQIDNRFISKLYLILPPLYITYGPLNKCVHWVVNPTMPRYLNVRA